MQHQHVPQDDSSTATIIRNAHEPSPRPLSVPVPIPEARREPVIELVREGDVVRQIKLRCSCGTETILNCDYGPAAG